MNTDINTHVAPLSERTMLVGLNRSMWAARKKDKRATRELLIEKDVTKGAASIYKSMLEGCTQLKDVQLQYNLAHREHTRMTQPFDDGSLRVLACPMFPEYTATMTTIINEFERLVDEFCISYEFQRVEAQPVLGDLYDATDYPDVNTVRSKFSMSYSPYPMPDSRHWALDMADDLQREIVAHFDKQMQANEARILKDIWGRTHAYLLNMSTQLGTYDLKDSPKLYDSLVSNVLQAADIMKRCNPTGDPQMEMAHLRITEALRGVTKDGLRESKELRQETKKSIDEIMKLLPTI